MNIWTRSTNSISLTSYVLYSFTADHCANTTATGRRPSDTIQICHGSKAIFRPQPRRNTYGDGCGAKSVPQRQEIRAISEGREMGRYEGPAAHGTEKDIGRTCA